MNSKRGTSKDTAHAGADDKTSLMLSMGVSLALLESKVDLRKPGIPWERRRQIGKRLRQQHPRERHAEWAAAKNRPSPLELIDASNVRRQKEFIPLRMGRMAATPFTFYRGAACIMAYDLKRSPVNGVNVVIDGDAHVNNFGLYGTPPMKPRIVLNI